jgi:hypothetical protein
MAQATAPAARMPRPIETYLELADDRWKTVTLGIDGMNGQPDQNSAVMVRYMDAVRQILGRMIHGIENDAEYTLLADAEERLMSAIGDEAEALVVAVETLRRSGS